MKTLLNSRKKICQLLIVLLAGILASCVTIDQLISKKAPLVEPPPIDCINTTNQSGNGNACLICHEDYNKNHHPINFIPPEIDLINIDKTKFPLFKGKIQCFTCHTAEGKYTKGNSKLLRGGPYSDIRQLCFHCHYKEKYSEINVHKMQKQNGGFRVIKGKLVCSFCHPQSISNIDTTETIVFKADVPFLCLRCHPEMRDPQIRPHFLKIPSEKIKIKMKEFEEQYNVILPLVPRGKISCSTCHNPHQKGVLISERAMAGADSPSRLRIEKFRLCYGCHL